MDATTEPGRDDKAKADDSLRRIPPQQSGVLGKVQSVLESARFQRGKKFYGYFHRDACMRLPAFGP